jgi:hypothetical protein
MCEKRINSNRIQIKQKEKVKQKQKLPTMVWIGETTWESHTNSSESGQGSHDPVLMSLSPI